MIIKHIFSVQLKKITFYKITLVIVVGKVLISKKLITVRLCFDWKKLTLKIHMLM